MDWGNIIILNNNVDGDIEAKLHLDGDFKKTKKKLTWLSATPRLTEIKLVDFDYLITKKKLEEGDSFEDCVNPITEFVVTAVGDENIKNLKRGDIIQLERKGYYIVDEASDTSDSVTLFSIPDGRAASVALKAPEKVK